MKKFLCLILILQFFILCACGATNDNSSNIHDNKNDNESSKNSQSSAISALNAYEKNVFDILVENISSFNNPNSVSIISCEAHYWDGKMIVLRISGENALGGVNTADYIVVTRDIPITTETCEDAQLDSEHFLWGSIPPSHLNYGMKQGDFYCLSTIGDPYSYDYEQRDDIPLNYMYAWCFYKYGKASITKLDLSISKVNLALKEYKEGMGW